LDANTFYIFAEKFRNVIIYFMKDPLQHFYAKFGIDKSLIHQIAAGAKYIGIMLKNGQIGVCSTLNQAFTPEQLKFDQPDLDNLAHRIFYNAYLNANLNYQVNIEDKKDIFFHIDFSLKNNIVMIGNFRPLVKKFMDAGIHLAVFDRIEYDDYLIPIDQMDLYLSKARTVILTSTTIFNGTFEKTILQSTDPCDVFLLGPSSILHPDMKNYRNVKKVYGAIFELFDKRILNIIAEGHGTQTFLKFGKKVNI